MKCDLRAPLRFLPLIVICAACTDSSTTRPDDTTFVVTATLSGLSVSPTSVTAGQHSTGTVLLSAGAPAGGATVSLAPDASGRATYPASVTVPQNATTNTFDITTSATASTGAATIVGTYSGGTASATLNVTSTAPPQPQEPHADFTVTPNAGTPANANQCAVYQDTRNGGLLNELRCVFDGSISTPNPGITAYSWTFPSGPTGTATYTGVRIASPTVACGTFAAATEKEVVLTISSPAGPDTIRKMVTFVKVGPC